MQVIVIGATHAGVAAIKTVLKYNPTAEVTVIERHAEVSFVAGGVPLYLEGGISSLNQLMYTSVADLTALGAKMLMQHDAIRIDYDRQEVLVQNLQSNEILSLPYDKIILATGSAVVVPSMRGVDAQRVMMVKDYQTTMQVVKATKANERITIIGGGYVGTELAAALAASGHKVTLLQRNSHLLPLYYDTDIALEVQNLLVANGVDIHLNAAVTGFKNGVDLQVCTADHEYPSDLALICTGFVPVSNLVAGHVDLDRRGAVITNDYGQSSDPNIYAAGDVRAAHSTVLGKEIYLPLASNAVRQGQLAGLNVAGRHIRDRGSQGSTASSFFGHIFASTGLTQEEAERYGLDVQATTYTDWCRMPSI